MTSDEIETTENAAKQAGLLLALVTIAAVMIGFFTLCCARFCNHKCGGCFTKCCILDSFVIFLVIGIFWFLIGSVITAYATVFSGETMNKLCGNDENGEPLPKSAGGPDYNEVKVDTAFGELDVGT